MDIKELAEPLPKDAVHWRIQGKPYERNGQFSAMALAYIDARDVMDRLDQVCGPQNWQTEFSETASGRVMCRLGIKVQDEWVWKTDGAGGTQVEAEKGGVSDALKRAAVNWGIGRYLYRLDAPWVRCEVRQKNGNTYWQRWAEDPWSKVKAPQPDRPVEFDPATERDRIKKAIEGARTLPGLQKTWIDNKTMIERLKAEKPPMFAEITKAKDDRKAALTPPDPGGQAPEDFDQGHTMQ